MPNKQDSNVTGLRIAKETTLGVLPGSPVWKQREPNSYSDFGGQITKVARRPINAGRQLKKGVTTDLDANGGFNEDLTQQNFQELAEGYFVAAFRRKGEEAVTAVDVDAGNPDEYEVASSTGFLVGSIIQGSGFDDAANNGVNVVTAVTGTTVEVATGTLVTDGSPATDAKIVVVGYQCASGDIDVDGDGDFPGLVSSVLNFTTLGLIPGEWIFVGGDDAGHKFVTAANNGYARVRTVEANRLSFDKTQSTLVDETGTGLTIRLFFGRVIKNEASRSLQVRSTYQQERTLGNDGVGEQSEYLVGGVPSQVQFNIQQADKMTVDYSFVHTDHEMRTGTEGVKAGGSRPTLVEGDAFNTSSDFARLKLALVDDADTVPLPLFAFLTELTLTINNNVSPDKAVAVLGAFDATMGVFQVSGSMTAYFADVGAVAAVRDNSNVTLDVILAKDNTGMVFDLPLVALGDGRANVELDRPITIPLTADAATAASIDTDLDHTMLMVFFDYLPNAAM